MDLGVPVSIFQNTTVNQGIPTGVGNIFNEGGYGTMAIENSSYSVIRGDVTWFKQEGLGGSHEFQTGFLLMPRTPTRARASSSIHRVVGGIAEAERPEQHELRDDPLLAHVRDERARDVNTNGEDHDYGVYLQDTWRPIHRLTMTLGVRA
jgi:outer membrane receptor protein involved in Fe transport